MLDDRRLRLISAANPGVARLPLIAVLLGFPQIFP
jgi:hypothetical protein